MTLETIRPGMILRPPAAASIRRMEARYGRRLDSNRTTDTWDSQMEKYDDYQAYRAGRGPKVPFALHPRESLHVYREDDPESGTVWDTDERGDWLADNGWIQTALPEEPWHLQYFIDRDNHRHETASTVTEPENPDMPVFIEPNIISWPNGYTNTYDRNVYLTCQWVANRQNNEAWAVDRYVHESWKAAEFMARWNDENGGERPSGPGTAPALDLDALANHVSDVLAQRLAS